jgi:leucyl-tRNA synthetase
LILTLWPFAPHIAEEMRSLLNFSEPEKTWPLYNEELTKTDEILIVLQVNGKVRQKLQIEAGISDEVLKSLALSDPKIQEWTQDKEIIKVIIVPKKLINIVVK